MRSFAGVPIPPVNVGRWTPIDGPGTRHDIALLLDIAEEILARSRSWLSPRLAVSCEHRPTPTERGYREGALITPVHSMRPVKGSAGRLSQVAPQGLNLLS